MVEPVILLHGASAGQAVRRPVSIGAVVTSIGGAASRLKPDGTDISSEWLARCARSWSALAPKVISVSESAPGADNVAWLKSPSKPSVAELLRRAQSQTDAHVVLLNSDICAVRLGHRTGELVPEAVYYATRHEVSAIPGRPGKYRVDSAYAHGFDWFLLPPDFLACVNQQGLLPEALRIGEPWWDFTVPVVALTLGFPVKKIGLTEPLVMHYQHPIRFSHQSWLRNGARFLELLERLQALDLPYASGLLEDLLQPQPGLLERLKHVTRIICEELP